MDFTDYKELIRHLAYEWAKVELPGAGLLYTDYIRIIGQLLTATQSHERTEYIFMGILKQAVELGKSSAWIEREIRFEELAEAVNRTDLVRLQLNYSDPIDDSALDNYNERKQERLVSPHRFCCWIAFLNNHRWCV